MEKPQFISSLIVRLRCRPRDCGLIAIRQRIRVLRLDAIPASKYTINEPDIMNTRNISDWIVALAVILCSAVLFGALALALSGTMLGQPERTVRVYFHDVTGIKLGSQVKFAGATAGRVSVIRIRTSAEREAGKDPADAVEVTLALTKNVPPLPSDITASVSADTLLSDKFLLLSGGSPTAPPLPNDAVIQGTTPVSFDQLVRNVDISLNDIRSLLGGTKDETGDLVSRVRGLLTSTDTLLTEARSVLGEARPVVTDAGTLITQTRGVVGKADVLMDDAGTLITENRQPIARTVVRLEKAAGSLDTLASRGNKLITDNGAGVERLITDFEVTGQNLRVTAAYARILLRSLAERPTRLIWGGRAPELPDEQTILQSPTLLPEN